MKGITINRIPIKPGMTTEALPDKGTDFASGIIGLLTRPIAEGSNLGKVARELNVQVDIVPTRTTGAGFTTYFRTEITGSEAAREKFKKALGFE